jgi:hypothetical protein
MYTSCHFYCKDINNRFLQNIQSLLQAAQCYKLSFLYIVYHNMVIVVWWPLSFRCAENMAASAFTHPILTVYVSVGLLTLLIWQLTVNASQQIYSYSLQALFSPTSPSFPPQSNFSDDAIK